MEWGENTVILEDEDPDEINVLGGKATDADRMEALLIKGPLSTAMLAIELNLGEPRVRSILSKNTDRFERNQRGFIQLIAEDRTAAVADGPLPW
jgi:hypothetical protein